MNTPIFLDKFQNAAKQINQEQLNKKGFEIAVGEVLDSVYLKLYKKSWATPQQDPLTAESRIFFSIWINDSAIQQQKLFYNIHALKLRKLKGYSMESRKFAEAFRLSFENFKHQWQNVSLNFGPLTLMEGWLKIDLENFQDEILKLVNNFIEIEYLIDNTLASSKPVKYN